MSQTTRHATYKFRELDSKTLCATKTSKVKFQATTTRKIIQGTQELNGIKTRELHCNFILNDNEHDNDNNKQTTKKRITTAAKTTTAAATTTTTTTTITTTTTTTTTTTSP